MDSFAGDAGRVSHVIIMAVFSFVAVVALALRLWARRIQRSPLEAHDYLCIIGFVCTLALALFTIHSQVYWDLGGNMTQVGNPDAVLGLVILQVKANIVGEALWAIAVFFIRASVLQLYIRIFRTKNFRIACYVVHGFNAAYTVSTMLAVFLICRPIAVRWDLEVPGGECGNQKAMDLYIGIVNLILDIAVVTLPMPVLWGLHLPVTRKVALTAMFSMGVIICVVTLVRIWVTSLIDPNVNQEYYYSVLALLTVLEAQLGVTNACLPVMKPALSKISESKLLSWATLPSNSSRPSRLPPDGPLPGGYTNATYQSAGSGSSESSSKNQKSFFWWERASKQSSMDDVKEIPPRSPTDTNATTIVPQTPTNPRYIDSKAAQIMFSHTTGTGEKTPGTQVTVSRTMSMVARPSTTSSITTVGTNKNRESRTSGLIPPTPSLPPHQQQQSMYSAEGRPYKETDVDIATINSDAMYDGKDVPGIVVQRDWDVERGADGIRGGSNSTSGSGETDRALVQAQEVMQNQMRNGRQVKFGMGRWR